MADQKLHELSSAEWSYLTGQLDFLERFCAANGNAIKRAHFSATDLQIIYDELAASDYFKDNPNVLINAFGAALGHILVRDHGFQWLIAEDSQGTDLAIVALRGTADVTVFPANLIAKRYAVKEQGFLVATVDFIVEQVRGYQEKSAKSKK